MTRLRKSAEEDNVALMYHKTKYEQNSFNRFTNFLGQIKQLVKLVPDPKVKKLKDNTLVSTMSQLILCYQGSICSIYLTEEILQSQFPLSFCTHSQRGCQIPTMLTVREKRFTGWSSLYIFYSPANTFLWG